MTVDYPQFGTMCEICYGRVTGESAATDENGDRWDVHGGDCARQAGISERTETSEPAHD